jgi:hypothetical protein
MANTASSALVIHHSNHAHGHQAAPDVIVDALPYYDSGYDEAGVREAVSYYLLFFFQLISITLF